MSTIEECALPDAALLNRYRKDYTDCFIVDCQGSIPLGDFVYAFYTTFVFKLERVILAALAARPSTDADASQLSKGEIEKFAAWKVEDRTVDQLLMCDFRGRTRSWFMVAAIDLIARPHTRLYFGSAVIKSNGKHSTSIGLLLGFHRLYSRILLRAAVRRVRKLRRRSDSQSSP